MKLLHLIGQQVLPGGHVAVRHVAKRRRVSTAIQKLTYPAAQPIHSGRRTVPVLGPHDRAAASLAGEHGESFATSASSQTVRNQSKEPRNRTWRASRHGLKVRERPLETRDCAADKAVKTGGAQ
jgi:hypothetical protein